MPVTGGSENATTVVAPPRADDTDPDTAQLRPGDILRERYVIERLLGEGGMGQVFLAVDREAEQTNPHVALKMLGESFKQHPQSLKALRREASQSQRMNHPNIVNVFYFERTEEHVFMVMEYMRGRSLDDYVEEKRDGAKLDVIWPIVDGMCQGLIYLHKQKVIHSDFKPSNVFVTDDGDVKVLDLGIARSLDEINAAQGTTRFNPDALGALTPSYASCEMFEGMTPNTQDDLYALGCVTYELLTGVHPYQRKTAIEARAESMEPIRPRGLKGRQWRALRSALGYTRGDRPPTVADFFQEIAPEKSSSIGFPITVSAAIVVAAIGMFALLGGDNSDERFIRTTLDRFLPGDNLVQVAEAQEWLASGEFFLDLGVKSLRDGEFDRATGQLLTAPNAAMRSYRLVLNRSDDTSVRALAAQGMLSIADAFKDTAASLVESGAEAAVIAKTLCTGLDVNHFDEEMLDLFKQMAAAQAPNRLAGIARAPECSSLVNTGKVSM